MNIWLINHYAVPPKYYPLARTTNFAKYLMRMGHTVTIFAASSVHNSDINLITDGQAWREETVDGVHYVYVRCRSYTGNGKQRIINMFEFPHRLKKVCRHFSRPDAVLASSATPPACMAGLDIAKGYGAKALAEVSDLWPRSFIEYGFFSASNPVLIPMYAYEKRMYQKADALIFTMEGAYDYIVEQGWDKEIPRSKVHYINNGVDLEQFDCNKEHFRAEDADLDEPDTFKVVYTGSIRKVNNLGLLLDAAKNVKDSRVRFLIWGDGDERAALEQRVREEHIGNVVFKGKVEKKYIPSIVSRADVNFAHNTPTPMFRFGISFNKLFDYFAAGQPILCDFPCSYNPAIVRHAGMEVSEVQPQRVAAAVDCLAALPETDRQVMGANARRAAEEYDFKRLTEKLVSVIESVP